MPSTLNFVPSPAAPAATPDLQALAQRMTGRVAAPASADWDEVRQAWALSADLHPAAVVLPESEDDVVAIVDFARRFGLRIAAQGTGHNAHPLVGALDATILLKTSQMREVQIDAEQRRARVQAGAIWTDVTVPAAEHGLAPLSGSSPDVGVVGYTLGGGLSFLSRRHGLAANHVTAIELVTADGRLVRTDREHAPDLFWALRGGGGSFGVITAMEFDLLPIAELYAGAAFWPQERAKDVLQAWREWTGRGLPEELTTVGRMMNFPPFPDVPEAVRGRSFVVVEVYYLGDEQEGQRLIAPLRELAPEFDTFATVPAVALSHLHMDPEMPVAGRGDGLLLRELTPDAIDAFVNAAAPAGGSALISAELRHLGGAIGRPAPEQGATGTLDGEYVMFAVGATPVPELRAVVDDQVDSVKSALAPCSAEHAYLNFAERPTDPRSLYSHEYTYRRLRSVKATHDPQDVFQSNHPIAPLD
jgi:hypothetical protein